MMDINEIVKITRENRYKQDDDYIIKKILERVLKDVYKAAADGRNSIEDIFYESDLRKFRYAVIEKLKAMKLEVRNEDAQDSYGGYCKNNNYNLYWKI